VYGDKLARVSQPVEVDWAGVVGRIQQRDPDAEEVLYRTLAGGARFFLQRKLGTQDVDDRVHDLFLTVVSTIRRGELEHPERLMGFVRTLLFRQLTVRRREAAAGFDTVAEMPSPATTPEERAIAAEKSLLMTKVLREMSDRDFEVLSRFYIREQTPRQICEEMGMTQVQFQLLKSRAKGRLTDLMRRKLSRASASPQ
jgi:RNA polymerase sigma-70 factor, ECF subfamily